VRVLYLIDSLAAGGAERSLAALAPAYRERDVELTVAYLHERPGEIREELQAAGAAVHSLAGAGGAAGAVWRGRRLLAARRPDLVHTTLFEADLVGRAAAGLVRVPVVSSLVNAAYGAEQAGAPGLRRRKLLAARALDAASARRVVRFHAISGHVADLMAVRLRLPRGRIDVVPRGRDPAALGERTAARRDTARAALGLPAGTPMVLAAARHEHQKGLDVLLAAFPAVRERVPAARLAVAGRGGNQTPLLEAAAARLGPGGSVAFLGARHDVPELLCAADAFVVPSRWEGFGSVLLEAMALEAPVVASDLPAIREVVADGATALLVPPEQPVALAAAVAATLADPASAAERARRARERFRERFTIDRVADGMVEFYRRALVAAGVRGPARARTDGRSGGLEASPPADGGSR
jgi:glycosyltransferase involved in cell wall biosynthesis